MLDRQGGQALPLGLALILFGALGALVLYNTGQAASDKTRLANAADAAAYSGALWQARALNFQAYTNRASVANEVSIAQGVGLRSWATYASTTSGNLGRALGPVPVLGQIANAVDQAIEAMGAVIEPVADVMVAVVDRVNAGLSASQEAMFASTFAATPEIVRTVALGNDIDGGFAGETAPRFTVDTLYSLAGIQGNLDGWSTFTDRLDTREDGHAAVRPRVDMINASLDPFSRQRDWEFFGFWFPAFPPFVFLDVVREGETRLVAVDGPDGPGWEWKAKDTVSLQTKRFRPFRKPKKNELPIGWAQAYANGDDDDGPSGENDRWMNDNTDAEAFAARNVPGFEGQPTSINVGNYGGLHAFRTLSATVNASDRPALKLKVEVAMPSARVRGSDRLTAGETFAAEVVAPGDTLSSIGIAEIYYQRPQSATGQPMPREKANGYNPYWDVRLSPVSSEERLLALALRPGGGGAVAPALATAGGDALGRYAGTGGAGEDALASLDAGIAGARALSGDLEGLGRDFAAEFVADAALPDADRIADVIEHGLADALENAAETFVRGLVDTALGSLAGTLDGLGLGPDGEVGRTIIDARAEGRATAERLDAASQRIADEFGPLVDAATADAQARVDALERDIDAARGELVSSVAERADIDARVAALDERRDEVGEEMQLALSRELVAITARHVDPAFYSMPLDIAQSVVRAVIEDTDDPLIDLLPWGNDDDDE